MSTNRFQRVQVIDSHTGGEPTRVVISGGPDLGRGDMASRREIFARDHDDFRSAVVNEPRGSDVLVGALLCEPVDPTCAAGVIFFNNVGMLHMCGHGTIGLIVTLAHMGRIGPGTHRIETPVGVVSATLEGSNLVTVENVPSRRYKKDVAVTVPGIGVVKGDIAWGGNWFFLVSDHGESVTLDNIERLTDVSWRIRQALEAEGITGEDGGVIDHIELFAPGQAGGDSRNFVLCPGKAYDRSPCGTGTSAKVACLAADGKLPKDRWWKQESVIGSMFEATASEPDAQGRVIPRVRGTAYVNSEATLILDAEDPFRMGIRA